MAIKLGRHFIFNSTMLNIYRKYPGALYVILSNCLLHLYTTFLYTIIISVKMKDNSALSWISKTYPSLIYILFPVWGWIADVYISRYRTILYSIILTLIAMLIGVIVITIDIALNGTGSRDSLYLYGTVIVFTLATTGIGMFEANATQFGIDQMNGASSEELSTYIQWYFWALYVFRVPLNYMIISSLSFCTSYLCSVEYLQFFVLILSTISLSANAFFIILIKSRLTTYPARYSPVSLLFRVLKYSIRNKHVNRRSAMTYWEPKMPSRIDLAKSKYGGPFTEEEVDNTIAFWRLIALRLSLCSLHIIGPIPKLKQGSDVTSVIPLVCALLYVHPSNFTHLIILISVPFFRIVLKPFQIFHRFQVTMIKRMWIGAVIGVLVAVNNIGLQSVLLKIQTTDNTSAVIQEYLVCRNNMSELYSTKNTTDQKDGTIIALTTLSGILQGLMYILIGMTIIEFIVAQAPYSMQGLLIGFSYAISEIYSITPLILQKGISSAINDTSISSYVYQGMVAFLAFLSLVFYSITAKWYHYRTRGDVYCEYEVIADTYTRRFAHEDEESKQLFQT